MLMTKVGWPVCQRVEIGIWARVPPVRGHQPLSEYCFGLPKETSGTHAGVGEDAGAPQAVQLVFDLCIGVPVIVFLHCYVSLCLK